MRDRDLLLHAHIRPYSKSIQEFAQIGVKKLVPNEQSSSARDHLSLQQRQRWIERQILADHGGQKRQNKQGRDTQDFN